MEMCGESLGVYVACMGWHLVGSVMVKMSSAKSLSNICKNNIGNECSNLLQPKRSRNNCGDQREKPYELRTERIVTKMVLKVKPTHNCSIH